MVAVSILLDSRGRGEEEERWKKKKTSRGFGRALKYKEQSRAETLWVERVRVRVSERWDLIGRRCGFGWSAVCGSWGGGEVVGPTHPSIRAEPETSTAR
jgi:hypothetical protein